LRCSYHQDREAIGTCTRCDRGICDECNIPVNGRYVCKNCIGSMVSHGQPCRKEPLLALILSFLLPGLGQIYNGDTNNGMMLIVGTVASWLMTSVCIGFFLFVGIWAYAMYDAYTRAEKINRGEITCTG
jgi:TM2 domain-containing membrane protein YozV